MLRRASAVDASDHFTEPVWMVMVKKENTTEAIELTTKQWKMTLMFLFIPWQANVEVGRAVHRVELSPLMRLNSSFNAETVGKMLLQTSDFAARYRDLAQSSNTGP